MNTPFLVSFDDLLQSILTQYRSLTPSPDTSIGSETYYSAVMLSATLLNLYRYQDWTANQVFPDTAATANMNHWGSIFGVPRFPTDADSDYGKRILTYLQAPPSGGNAQDYYNWSLVSTATVAASEQFLPGAVDTALNYIHLSQNWISDSDTIPDIVTFTTTGGLPSGLSLATNYYVINVNSTVIQVSASRGGSAVSLGTQGTGTHTIVPDTSVLYHAQTSVVVTPPTVSAGTVTVVVEPNNTDNTLDSTGKALLINGGGTTYLLSLIAAYIDSVRPVTAGSNTILITTPQAQTVEIRVLPNNLTPSQLNTMATDVAAVMNALTPGQTLYVAQLSAACITDGAISATVITPAADVVPASYAITITLDGSPDIHV
jgi:uncharacterized phage protein gp47/JayE